MMSMKYLNKFWLGAAAIFVLASCADDSKLEFDVAKPESIARLEYLNDYKELKTYVDRTANANFKLGAGVTVSNFLKKSVEYSFLLSNFDELTAGYEMKHGAIVKDNGTMDFTNVDNFVTATKEAGISVYGHTLVWHANQNAKFLNSLIAPVVIPGAAGPSWKVMAQNTFETDDASNYSTSATNAVKSFTAAGQGANGTGRALKILNDAVRANDWNSQLFFTIPSPTVAGDKFKLTMDVKADAAASYSTQAHTAPGAYKHWDFFGTISATTSWVTYVKEITIDASTAGCTTIAFNLGKTATTYYFDNIKVEKWSTGGGGGGLPGEVWIEAETASPVGSKWKKLTDTSASGGEYMVVPNTEPNGTVALTNTALITDADVIKFTVNVSSAGAYKLWVRAAPQDASKIANDDSYHFSMDGGSWYTFNNAMGSNTAWTWYTVSDYTLSAGSHTLTVSFREDGAKLDKLFLTKNGNTPTGEGGGSGDLIIEKTPKQKQDTITYEMRRWIKGMMAASKSNVKAWDVVNEPMDDGSPFNLKTGVGKTLKTDEFYWQDYMGKDYAVEAFKLAAQNGNSGDKLFINDYNLEYSLDKCKGLIDYVKYIESKGARVDGIGTQMHISTTSDKNKIVEMFKLLAATGKLIKVSELDMGVGKLTTAATDADMIAQSEMYNFVVKKYFELIPAAQRYGITVWSPKDSPASSSWRAGEPIGLWTEGYYRKRAYAGFADGLSGK